MSVRFNSNQDGLCPRVQSNTHVCPEHEKSKSYNSLNTSCVCHNKCVLLWSHLWSADRVREVQQLSQVWNRQNVYEAKRAEPQKVTSQCHHVLSSQYFEYHHVLIFQLLHSPGPSSSVQLVPGVEQTNNWTESVWEEKDKRTNRSTLWPTWTNKFISWWWNLLQVCVRARSRWWFYGKCNHLSTLQPAAVNSDHACSLLMSERVWSVFVGRLPKNTCFGTEWQVNRCVCGEVVTTSEI